MPSNILIVYSLDSRKGFEYSIYSDSFDLFLESFIEKFDLGEILICFFQSSKYDEVLELGEIIFEANCNDSCSDCTDEDADLCHRICSINFVAELNKRLVIAIDRKRREDILESKFWDDFLNGKATYPVC